MKRHRGAPGAATVDVAARALLASVLALGGCLDFDQFEMRDAGPPDMRTRKDAAAADLARRDLAPRVLLRGIGHDQLGAPIEIPIVGTAQAMAAADVNGDQIPDLLLATDDNGTGSLVVLLGVR